ncbi:MAG: tetratricopeptide repeat protein [Bdellovibrio sp.]|nr:tetratricopeptide repeat protein [Bdellovibrio sp.]
MRKLLFLTALIYLSACSTSSKKEVESAEAEDTAVTDTKPVGQDDVEIKKDAPIASSMYAALNESIKQQNDEQIQKASGEILTQNPKDLRALNSLALVYYKRGRFEAAQYLLNKALSANPKSSEVYGNLGTVMLAKGDRREAVKMFRKALEINPDDSLVGANLGAIYVQEKDYNKALLALEIPVRKGMKDQKVLNNYAISLVAKARPKEAAEIYEKILKENPANKEVMLNFAILQIDELKKYKQGLDLLNRLKFVGPPSESRQVIKELEIKAKAGLQ